MLRPLPDRSTTQEGIRIGYLIATGAECNVDFSRACEYVATTSCVVAHNSDCSNQKCAVAVGSDRDPEPTPTATPTAVAKILEILQGGGSQ